MTDHPPPGLCASCRHSKPLLTKAGAQLSLCGLSKTDPGFARFPPLPVLACRGFEE